MHRHTKNITTGGLPTGKASKLLIMIHGRGASAPSILTLADHLNVNDFALWAPQANQNTWYPYSFMAPTMQNEPGLSTALEVLKELVHDAQTAGFKSEDIYFLGFSQGACLTSEFVARNANKYGGVFIFSGGVIGETINKANYSGDFAGTPIFLGNSDKDAHVPLHRVQDSTAIFIEMGAAVTERIYPNAPHTVLEDEIEFANSILQKV